jgi:putative endonuclease
MAQEKSFYVYILASGRNGTLYTGVTSDLVRRVYEHKNDLIDGFTKKYCVHSLVYYEACGTDPTAAITREKTVKHWPRRKKLQAIERHNPLWRDLASEWLQTETPGFSARCAGQE